MTGYSRMVTCLCTRVYIPEAEFYIPVFITLVSTSSIRIHCRSILHIKVHINSSFCLNTTTAVYIALFHNLASVLHSTAPSTTPTSSEVINPPLTKDQQSSFLYTFRVPNRSSSRSYLQRFFTSLPSRSTVPLPRITTHHTTQ